MLAFAVGAAGQEATPEPAIQMLCVGAYFASNPDLTPKGADGEEWLGVFPVDEGHELRRVALRVERYRLRAPNPEDGDPMIRMWVDGDREPLFLVRGMADVEEGPIDMTNHRPREGEGFLYPEQTVYLSPDVPSRPRAAVSAHGVAAPPRDQWDVTDYRLDLTYGGAHQTLIELPGVLRDYPVGLIWSGDIDRDGVPDVLLDAHPREVGEVYHLFLSSQAEQGDTTRLVAVFTIPGC